VVKSQGVRRVAWSFKSKALWFNQENIYEPGAIEQDTTPSIG
jgi:hypothetical protein